MDDGIRVEMWDGDKLVAEFSDFDASKGLTIYENDGDPIQAPLVKVLFQGRELATHKFEGPLSHGETLTLWPIELI